MDRRKFILSSCAACLSAGAVTGLLSACSSAQFVAGELTTDGILINENDFKITRKGKTSFRSFIIIRHEALQYPICLYRVNEHEYSALWMQCSHQGAELQASGDMLQCSAHGSEFNITGKVTSGPADKDLRTFPVSVANNQLFIDLRKK